MNSTALQLRQIKWQFDLLVLRSTVAMQYAVTKNGLFHTFSATSDGLGLGLVYLRTGGLGEYANRTTADRPLRKIIPLIRPALPRRLPVLHSVSLRERQNQVPRVRVNKKVGNSTLSIGFPFARYADLNFRSTGSSWESTWGFGGTCSTPVAASGKVVA